MSIFFLEFAHGFFFSVRVAEATSERNHHHFTHVLINVLCYSFDKTNAEVLF